MKQFYEILKQQYFFTPLNVISKEQVFLIWPVFTIFFAFISSLFTNSIVADGASYTYAVGVLTPLIFDKLIDEVISIRSKKTEHFATLKLYYTVFALIIVVIACFSYASGRKENYVITQLLVFFFTSVNAYLFYLCMHMSDFPELIEKFDDKPYQMVEDEQVNELKEVATEIGTVTDNEGVRL